MTSVRFKEELGDGAFGKIYRGEVGSHHGQGLMPGSGTLVGIKTLRPGAASQTRHVGARLWNWAGFWKSWAKMGHYQVSK